MKCLFCYTKLNEGERNYHTRCVKKFFGTQGVPDFPYSSEDIHHLAKKVVQSRTTVTGVQAKLSMEIERLAQTSRFTIVDAGGKYILKPQTAHYTNLPENEDLTMHLAEIVKIEVVPHALLRFDNGELCYITKRIDRDKKGEKIPMEDMCQLTEQLTERKYKGSYEKIAKAIRKYSTAPGLDVTKFWTVVLFSWLVGNTDMHLKNFSLYAPNLIDHILTPAYDLLNTILVMPTDTEELALTLNGKKSRLTRHDFEQAMRNTGLNEKVIANIFNRFQGIYPQWVDCIHSSFLPVAQQDAYCQLLRSRLEEINML